MSAQIVFRLLLVLLSAFSISGFLLSLVAIYQTWRRVYYKTHFSLAQESNLMQLMLGAAACSIVYLNVRLEYQFPLLSAISVASILICIVALLILGVYLGFFAKPAS